MFGFGLTLFGVIRYVAARWAYILWSQMQLHEGGTVEFSMIDHSQESGQKLHSPLPSPFLPLPLSLRMGKWQVSSFDTPLPLQHKPSCFLFYPGPGRDIARRSHLWHLDMWNAYILIWCWPIPRAAVQTFMQTLAKQKGASTNEDGEV